MEFGYAGNVGRKLESWTMGNYPVYPGPGSVQARRPFPASGVIQVADHRTNSSYNGASVKVERRFTAGLTFMSSYTLSRSIDDGSSIRAHINDSDFPQNPYDLTDRHGLSAEKLCGHIAVVGRSDRKWKAPELTRSRQRHPRRLATGDDFHG